MLATWLSRLGVKTRIVDKRSTKIFTVRPAAFPPKTWTEAARMAGSSRRTAEPYPRSVAELRSRGSNPQGGQLPRQSTRDRSPASLTSATQMEICFWNPDEKGQLNRTARIPDSIAGISRYSEVVLHQGRIERVLLDSMRSHGLDVERAVLPDQLDIDESQASNPDAYPVQVRLRHLTDDEASRSRHATLRLLALTCFSVQRRRSSVRPRTDSSDQLCFKTTPQTQSRPAQRRRAVKRSSTASSSSAATALEAG